jgi:tetratricopeptide (TPR) repeat protein
VALHLLGRVTEALMVSEEAQKYARESKHLFSLGLALTMGCLLYRLRRDPGVVSMRAEELIGLAEEGGFGEWLRIGRFYHGWSLAQLGQPDRGITEMEVAIATYPRTRWIYQHHMIGPLAHSYASVSRVEEGLAKLDDALAEIRRTGGKVDEPEILRLKGELLLMRNSGAVEQAEACFRVALEIARAQDAKWWELRTTTSLACLLRDTNRCDEGRTMLAEIYNWFTEGFDTADLKEAKALLDQLSL